jgi:precorrin-6A synthase
LNRSDVVLLPAKGPDTEDLLRVRYEICERYVEGQPKRMVEIDDPERAATPQGHRASVERWYEQRISAWETALLTHVADGEAGAFLVWGDPSLYDGTLRVLQGVRERGRVEVEIEVVPGIGAPQVLAARHKIALNQVGGSVVVTTGRTLREGRFEGEDDVVVMLDPQCSFEGLADQTTLIYWGAYLGMPNEILISGTVGECGEAIEAARAQARSRHGWVFDTYLLRRVQPQ